MAAKNNHIREAALSLMRKGLATPFEIHQVSGMSRQLAFHWAKSCNLSRAEHLKRLWDKTLSRQCRSGVSSRAKEKNPLRKSVEEI